MEEASGHGETTEGLNGDRVLDTRTKSQRSEIMRAVRQKDTGPERLVRSILHTEGYRYRLHAPELPGKPDVVFRPRKKAVFVHGCFWHGHRCKGGRPPKSRTEYWKPKISGNKARDRRQLRELRRMGWKVLVVWQCETKNPERLRDKLVQFMEDRHER